MPGGWHAGQAETELGRRTFGEALLLSPFSVEVFDLIQRRHRPFHQLRFISIHVGWALGSARGCVFPPPVGMFSVYLIKGPLQEGALRL